MITDIHTQILIIKNKKSLDTTKISNIHILKLKNALSRIKNHYMRSAKESESNN